MFNDVNMAEVVPAPGNLGRDACAVPQESMQMTHRDPVLEFVRKGVLEFVRKGLRDED
jgi:hypothetical protein